MQPTTQTLQALERRLPELEADLVIIGAIIQHLERALPESFRRHQRDTWDEIAQEVEADCFAADLQLENQ